MQVISRPHPFSRNPETLEVPHGISVQELVDDLQPKKPLQNYLHVYLDGKALPRQYWKNVRPKQGTEIVVNSYPAGGGGNDEKSTERTAFMVVVQVAAAYFTGGIGNAFYRTAATVAIAYAGAYIAQQLWPLPTPEGDPENLKDVRAGRNQEDRYGAVPTMFGRHRITPNLAAPPFNDVQGDDQYVNILYAIGHAPLNVERSSIKFGDTDLSTLLQSNEVEVEIYDGHNNRDQNTIFREAVVPNNLNQQLERLDFDQADFDLYESEIEPVLPDNGDVRSFSFNSGQSKYINVTDGAFGSGVSPWAEAVRGWTYSGISGETSGVPNHFSKYGVAVAGPEGAIRVDVNLSFPQGLYAVRENGQRQPMAVNIAVLYREVGATNWVLGQEQIVSEKTRTPFRKQISLKLSQPQSENKQYEVVIGCSPRIVPNAWLNNETVDTVILNQVNFRIGQTDPFETPIQNGQEPVANNALAWLAIRVKAGEITGNIDRLSCVAQTIVPKATNIDWEYLDTETVPEYYDRIGLQSGDGVDPTTGWKVSSNPGDMYRWALQGPWAREPAPLDRVDRFAINSGSDSFSSFCVDKGFECNLVVNNFQPLSEVIKNILATSRGTFSVTRDGKYSVAFDKTHASPVQMFTPKNSREFQSGKAFIKVPHALKLSFFDEEKDYKENERVVYNDGYDHTNATRFEEISVPGVTNKDQIYKLGRYNLASMILRPENHTLVTDAEYLVCQKGDMVSLAHDVIQVGQTQGRLVTVGAGSPTFDITLDEEVVLDGSGLSGYGLAVRTASGDKAVLTVDSPSDGTFDPGTTITVTLQSGNKPQEGDLYSFGIAGKEVSDMIVSEIETADDYSARLMLFDYAPEIFDTDTEVIPPFNPNITTPVEFAVPDSPELDSIESGVNVLAKDENGDFLPRIRVILKERPDTQVPISHLEAQIRAREETTDSGGNTVIVAIGSWVSDAADIYGNRVYFEGLQSGDLVDMRFRYVSEFDQKSDWFYENNYTVVGLLEEPPKVINLTYNQTAEGVVLSWDEPDFPITKNYWVTTSNATNPDGSPLNANTLGKTTSSSFDLGLITTNSTYYVFHESEGNVFSDPVAVSVAITGPTEPLNFFAQQTRDGVEVTWDASSTVYPLDYYELREDNDFGNDVGLITRTSSTKVVLERISTLTEFNLMAVDITGLESPFTIFEFVPTTPGDMGPIIVTQTKTGFDVEWDDVSITYPLDFYEVRTNTNWGSNNGLIAKEKKTKTTLPIDSSTYTIYIRAQDVEGLTGASNTATVAPQGPSDVQDFFARTLDNTLLFSWAQAQSIWPIDTYELKKGDVFADSENIGNTSSTFQAYEESSSGNFTYWITAIDQSGLRSTPVSIKKLVDEPPDFVLRQEGRVNLELTDRDHVVLQRDYPNHLEFDGTNRVEVTDNTAVQFDTNMSLQVWVFVPETLQANNTLVHKHQSAAGQYSYILEANTDGDVLWGAADTASNIPCVNGTRALNKGHWNHIAASYDGTTAKLFINGDETWQDIGTTVANPSTDTDLHIGRNVDFSNAFVGAVRDFSFWSSIRTEADIENSMFIGFEGTETNLAAYYQLNEGHGNTAFDSTSNDNDGEVLEEDQWDRSPHVGFTVTEDNETWEQHFQRIESTLGLTGPITIQQVIDGGYDYYLQPTLSSGYLERIIDLGGIVGGTRLQMELNGSDIVGDTGISPTVGFSSDGTTFSDTQAFEAFGKDFQYIKLRLDFDNTDNDKDLYKIQELTYALNVKQKTDQGKALIAQGTPGDGGTEIQFNQDFIDINAINVTVKLASNETEDDFTPVVIFDDDPNPTSFSVVVFDSAGNRVEKNISWIARGV